MTVDRFLADSAQRRPDHVGLVVGDRRATYEELQAAASRLAAALRRHGVRRGDRVVCTLDQSIESVVTLFATFEAGGVFVPLNPTIKPNKLAHVLTDARPAALIVSRRQQPLLGGLGDALAPLSLLAIAGGTGDTGSIDRAEVRAYLGEREGEAAATPSGRAGVDFDRLLADAGDSPARPAGTIDLDLAMLIYTSGSTGTPKGVMLSHRNIVSAATSILGYLGTGEDDVVLNALPLSFDYGLYQVLMTCKVGARVVLERGMAFPHAFLERLAAEHVTGLPIVPTMAALLLQMDLTTYDLSSLRFITNTGAVLPPEHIRELRARLPHVRLFSMYGLTECKRVAYLPPQEVDRVPGSVGRAMPNVEVYLVDEAGRRMDEGVGQLVVRGSNVMEGYWNRPDETAVMLKPGALPGERVLYTGDIFRIDAEGLLYFVGRTDDIIKSRGEKVAPREVENAICGLAGVAEACVVGVADEVLGQAIKAFVRLRPGSAITEPDILRHCAAQLESFMVPSAVEIVPELPRTSTGKIARQELAR